MPWIFHGFTPLRLLLTVVPNLAAVPKSRKDCGPWRLKGGFSRATPLQFALDRGMQPARGTGDELRQLGDYCIKVKADAEAVCRVLARCVGDATSLAGETSLQALIGLFQDVEGPDCPAFETMVQQGVPILIDLVNAGCVAESGIDPEHVLFALKILAVYGTTEGTDAVIRAARQPFEADSYWWHLILQAYGEGHPESGRLFQALSEKLPEDFLAFSLLDSANAALGRGTCDEHPFDTEVGHDHLEKWLTERDHGHFTYAIGAAAALPYLARPARDRLMAIAWDHPSDKVRLEAAKSSAKLVREAGIDAWPGIASMLITAQRALEYLEELNRDDAVPPKAFDPDFAPWLSFRDGWLIPTSWARPPTLSRSLIDANSLGRQNLTTSPSGSSSIGFAAQAGRWATTWVWAWWAA